MVGKFNGQVRVCQRRDGGFRVERRPLLQHHGQARAVTMLRNRKVQVTAGSEGKVNFLSWENRASLGSVRAPVETLTSLHVSQDGTFMAIGDSDRSMSLWDLRVMDVPMLFARPFAEATPQHLQPWTPQQTQTACPAHCGARSGSSSSPSSTDSAMTSRSTKCQPSSLASST